MPGRTKIMVKITAEQRKSIHALFLRNPDGANSYKELRQRAVPELCGPAVMLPWCGMWVGIEKDGHRHT